MNQSRTANATRNIIFGFLLKIYQIIVPFIIRTVMIYFMGIEYVGLNSLFTSILSVLNLAELGVGSAMVYSMYKPITENDSNSICALLNLYKKYYKNIGLIIFVFGMCLCPFIPYLVKSDMPQGTNIYVLYIMNLMLTVLSYWLFSYKNSLLQAHQRSDVVSKITLIINTIQYIVQFFVICILKDYYAYILISLISQTLVNLCIAFISSKMYPNYKATGELNKNEVNKINGRVRDLFTSKLGSVIVNSADTIVISAFLGLTTLALYQNYYYILSAVIGIVSVIFSSCTSGLGNSIILESKSKNLKDFNTFTFIIFWINCFCTCCLVCMYQPFMQLWVGKEMMLDFNIVICLCIYFFVYELNQFYCLYKDAAGMWHEDRFRPLVTAIVNLSLNLIMVNFLGLYGILLSTIISMVCVGIPWVLQNIFSSLFDKKNMIYHLKKIFFYIVSTCIICTITYFVCNFIQFESILSIIKIFMICLIIPNIFILILFSNSTEFKESMLLLKRIIKGKLKK